MSFNLKSLILATNNAGKVAEIRNLLATHNLQVSCQADHGIDSIPETGLTFVENALLKARHVCTHADGAALGDDSGLVVPALDGAPGLYSARYAGANANDTENYQKLLQAMSDFSGEDRRAIFVCVLTLLRHSHDPEPVIAIGRWHGHIAGQADGEHGFGYDPVFIADGYDQTAARLEPEHKQRISHRALALQSLLKQLNPQLNQN